MSRKKKIPVDLSIYKGIYKGIVEISVDVVGSELLIKKPGQTGNRLFYSGNQEWSLGNEKYSFKVENGKVKEMHWDLISAHLILRKE